MNLVRLGHLYTPLGSPALQAEKGDCSTALVVNVNGPQEYGETVNLAVFDHQGLATHGHFDVPVVDSDQGRLKEDALPNDTDTFHLSGVCPWER